LLPQLDRTCWVALEVTGSAFELHDALSPHVDQALLANPVDLKRLGSGRHTDRVDAARLAKMLAVGTLPTVWVPPQPMREVRRLVYYRARLASSRRRAINQAKVVLRRAGHVLPRETDVRRWLTAERMAALPASDRVILLSTCRQITALEAEIDGIEGEIARAVAAVPAIQVLLTITGVGLITAAATWAIVGDPHRFSRTKQVARYAGLDPSIVQSGEQHRQGRISKAGSPLLRTLLVEAAHSLARWDNGPLGQFYTRKAQEVGARKAIIALAGSETPHRSVAHAVDGRSLPGGPSHGGGVSNASCKGRSGFSYQQRCRLSLLRATPDHQPHAPEARRLRRVNGERSFRLDFNHRWKFRLTWRLSAGSIMHFVVRNCGQCRWHMPPAARCLQR